MARVSLPVLTLALREQRYSCHGCGNCCRDFTVQLRDDDLAKLQSQEWERKLGEPATVEFKGQTYLRQRDNGSCIFLMENGLCRIHAEYGFESKPIACQLFPFHLTPTSKGVTMGINFACQSVLENKGGELRSHQKELMRMTSALPELNAPISSPLLSDKFRASPREEQSLINHIDDWLKRSDINLSRRIDGLAWVTASLAKANLQNVREERFNDLLDVLVGALPDELDHYPIDPPTPRQRRMLRQAVFARTEDPKLSVIGKQGGIRLRWSQLQRSRRFKSGRGLAPKIGETWPSNVALSRVELIHASPIAAGGSPRLPPPPPSPSPPPPNPSLAHSPHGSTEIDELITRYLRASILGARYWGAGYYGWSMINGLQALLLNVACIGWLARLHAAGRHGESIEIVDARAAIGRIDRTAGRAKWLGSAAERLRLAYLNMDEGLRRLVNAYSLTGLP